MMKLVADDRGCDHFFHDSKMGGSFDTLCQSQRLNFGWGGGYQRSESPSKSLNFVAQD